MLLAAICLGLEAGGTAGPDRKRICGRLAAEDGGGKDDVLRNAPTWRVERMVHHSSIGGVPAEQTEGGNKQQLSYGHEVEQSQLQSNRTENLVRWTKEARQAYIRGAVDKSNRVR